MSRRLQASHLRLGALACAGPLALLAIAEAHATSTLVVVPGSAWGPRLAVAVAALFPLSAWLEGWTNSPQYGRRLLVLAVLGAWVLIAPAVTSRPALALTLLLAGGGVIAWVRLERLFRPGVLGGRPQRQAEVEAASLVQGAAATALLTWFLAVPAGVARTHLTWAGVYAALASALLLGLHWAWGSRQRHPGRLWKVAGSTALCLAAAAFLSRAGLSAASLPLAAGVACHGLAAWRRRRASPPELESWWEPVFHEPARMLAATFFACGVAGGVVLSLPAATTRPVELLDGFFTSFSAVCVTGLIVLDTPHDFTGFGQAVILLLIQVGGLGIMSFSTAALVLFGRRLSLKHEAAVSHLLSNEDRSDLRTAIQKVFGITFAAEFLGALMLTLCFVRAGDSLGAAAWRGTFTAVSAFCNAGFALQSDSLIPYQGDPLVLHVVAALIVVGGLGPVTIALLPHLLRRRVVPVQAKLVLITTGVLLVAPALFLVVAEWDRGLAGVGGPLDKLSNAWFQSVTLRTAGFNSVDLNALRPATVTVMLALMFVGGSPGSTAGGVKTTTAAIAALATWAAIRGRTHVEILGVRVAQGSVYKTAAVMTLGALGVVAALTALQLTQQIPLGPLLFETVSALGTVGLSLGATGELDSVGKVIVIGCMFAGRVGPLTLFVLLARQGRRTPPLGRPEQDVVIG